MREGITVVGLHGTYDAKRTPALVEPVYAIDGYLCDANGEHDFARVEDADWGCGTRVEPFPATEGHIFIVTGPMEERVSSLIRKGGVNLGGGVVATYLPADIAKRRKAMICYVARRAVTSLFDEPGLYDNPEDVCWWLQRAASDDADRLVAIAGLRRIGSPHWSELLRSCFPELCR